MAKFNSNTNFQTVVELLYEELKTFRLESKEENQRIEMSMAEQSRTLQSHTEQLIKLIQLVHGNGNKGLIDRIEDLEKSQEEFSKKFQDIETKEKIRAAVLGVICALCSSLGGIITYVVSIYTSLK